LLERCIFVKCNNYESNFLCFYLAINQSKKDKNFIDDLEAKIDKLVYKLYELAFLKVLIVESAFGLRRFDNFLKVVKSQKIILTLKL
jgi:hypothetical protein